VFNLLFELAYRFISEFTRFFYACWETLKRRNLWTATNSVVYVCLLYNNNWNFGCPPSRTCKSCCAEDNNIDIRESTAKSVANINIDTFEYSIVFLNLSDYLMSNYHRLFCIMTIARWSPRLIFSRRTIMTSTEKKWFKTVIENKAFLKVSLKGSRHLS